MKKLFKLKLVLLQFTVLISVLNEGFSQDCIAVRSMSTANENPSGSAFMQPGSFQVLSHFRKLHSYKHFAGTVEQPYRVEQKTEVINDAYNFDFGLTYALTNRLNLSINVPLLYNDRSHYTSTTETEHQRDQILDFIPNQKRLEL